jgi:starvation-inducible outer membrane lipoprotein
MTKVALFLTLIMLLAGCTAGPPMTACPDPDPNPISPCATSHSQTHGMM